MRRRRTDHDTPLHPGYRLGALLATIAIMAGACGGNGGDDSSSAAASESMEGRDTTEDAAMDSDDLTSIDASGAEVSGETSAGDGAATEGEAGSPVGGTTETAGVTAADLNRSIIYTATVEVDVDDVAAAGRDAVAAIEAVGGFVFGQESVGGAEPRSVFEFKVRPSDFDEALAALDGIGELRNQVISADDVTERVVDLESRIQVAELGVDRLRATLEATTTLDDFAEIERLLLERESELEIMRGQIRTLQDQVDLATITLVLTQDRVVNGLELTVTSYEEHNAGLSCPSQSDRSLEAGTDLTICFELVNVGDQPLSKLTLVDTGLGITSDTELITVFGSLRETLPPGQSIILAFETKPDRDLRLRTVAGGQPVSIDGQDPAGPPVTETRNSTIAVTPGNDVAGFGDGFEAGTTVIAGVWSAVRLSVGFLLPLLVLVPFVVVAGWLGRVVRRRRGARSNAAASHPGYAPPPSFPASVPAPTDAAAPTNVTAPTSATSPSAEPASGGEVTNRPTDGMPEA